MNRRNISIRNRGRDIAPLLIGPSHPTRVVANIGLSPKISTIEMELKKAQIAVEMGADIIADHTITSKVEDMLECLLSNVDVPVSTVPYYEVGVKALKERGSIVKAQTKDIFNIIEKQANMGIDVMTIHASLTKGILDLVKKSRRIIKIPSRGGAWVAAYMISNKAENPMYENLDQILDILKSYNVTLSLGPSVRPGSIVDGLDEAVIMEIVMQKEIVEKALNKGVQVIVEYGGHLRADVIPILVNLVKKLCNEVPLRTLITATDVAVAFDHIAAAIASAIAAMNGAEILVAISPAEHLGLPRLEDFREGIAAFKVASHIADIVKHNDLERDKLMSTARKRRDWESMWKYAIYGSEARNLFRKLQRGLMESDHCTMCGPLCAHRIVEEFMG